MERTVAVLYQSEHGTTRQYAEWISETLQADLYSISEVQSAVLDKYSVIIFGGSIYAGKILGARAFSKIYPQIAEKKLLLFTVGLANPATTDYQEIMDRNFTQKLQRQAAIFHLRGGIDYRRLSWIHRMMMFFMKKQVEKQSRNKQSEESMLFLETYGKQIDFSDRSTIKPLIQEVQG